MPAALMLISLGVICRLVPHWPNAVPLGALSLYAGARLPVRRAWMVPLAALALSDVVIDSGSGRPIVSAMRLTIYSTYAALVALGPLASRRVLGGWSLPVLSVAASALFFLASNAAVWATSGMYPTTAAGLAACYVAALPFFGNTLLADLAGTAVLFGAAALADRVRAVLQSRRGVAAPGAGVLRPEAD
jgi:hypothetical protein